MQPADILEYWSALGSDGWWTKNDAVDREIVSRFGALHDQAVAGDLGDWTETPDGALALVIILDQFSRNMFRGDAKTFAQDPLAFKIAKSAIQKGWDTEVQEDLRMFFYLPYEHSESILVQQQSLRLFNTVRSVPNSMKAAREHHDIIKRFGRFPHRNAVLGRHTTPAEQAYLDGGGFKG